MDIKVRFLAIAEEYVASLMRAAEEACERALFTEHGVRMTIYRADMTFTVEPHPDVPWGTIEEVWTDKEPRDD